ncbi:MAG: right-handed parallel beta-helix repeat-containing protein [Thermoanaerobaculia bacterium]
MSRGSHGRRVVGMRTESALEASATQPAFPPTGVRTRNFLGGAALLSLVLGSPPAWASDGIIEINQAKALAGGVTAGDAPGFPVTLSQEGSYRLTGNLTVAELSTAIVITSWNVSLDLGGFTVSGPNACTGYPTTGCTAEGGEPGIWADGVSHHVRLQNGVVRSFNGRGVYLQGASSTAESLRVMLNGDNGIEVAASGRIVDCISLANLLDGIHLSSGFIEASEARANGRVGIWAGSGRVSHSEASWNGRNGIELTYAGFVEKNTATSNLWSGILMSGARGLAIENRAVGNALSGIDGGGALLSRNVGQDNGGAQVGGGNSLGDNLCGFTLC